MFLLNSFLLLKVLFESVDFLCSALQLSAGGYWTCATDGNERSCYIFLGFIIWEAARDYCKTMAYGGHLAEITSIEEYNLIHDLLDGK